MAQRAAQGCQVLGLRFKDDELVGERFAALRDLLGTSFIAVELDSPTPRAHSVLTEDRDEPSVREVIQFLTKNLHPTTP